MEEKIPNNFRKSKIDRISTSFTNRFKFFKNGFGDESFLNLIPGVLLNLEPVTPQIDWYSEKRFGGIIWKKGRFPSPFQNHLPPSAQIANVRMISPREIHRDTPICIHFAMTGDQGFSNRLFSIALPLLKDGIASIILEIPYYGKRKPKTQFNVLVETVSDFLKMCGGTIAEGLALISYARMEGFQNIGVSGVSMGGNISCFVTSLTGEPIASVPCLPPHSPQPVFFSGMLKGSVNWKSLKKECDGDLEKARLKLSHILDSSDLLKFPKPVSAKNVVFVAGEADAIVSPETVMELHRYWEGSEIRWVKGGHVGSIFGKTGIFRQAIRDSFQKLIKNRQ